jgi:catechol 2,3-dioxygenase-like lactoylglutathione lyase family enzyme
VTEPCSLKTMLRCGDFEGTRRFYTELLGLQVVEEWNDPGDRGCILRFGAGQGFLELLHAGPDEVGDPAFAQRVANDKIEIQIHVASIDTWVKRLEGRVPFEGPVRRPWGNRYLWIRDPEGLRIALFQGPSE